MARVSDKPSQVSVDYRGLEVPEAPAGRGHRTEDVTEIGIAKRSRSVAPPIPDSANHADEARPASRVLTGILRRWSSEIAHPMPLGLSNQTGRHEGSYGFSVDPALSPNGRIIVAPTQGGVAYSIQIDEDGSLRQADSHTFQSHRSEARPTFTASGSHVLIPHLDGALHVFEVSEQGRLSPVDSFMTDGALFAPATLSPNGDFVLVGSRKGSLYSIRLHDDGTLASTCRFDSGCGEAFTAEAVFSPDGKFVVVGMPGGTLQALRFGSDGRLVESGGALDLGGGHGFGSRVQFLPDGKHMVARTNSGILVAVELGSDGSLKKIAEFNPGYDLAVRWEYSDFPAPAVSPVTGHIMLPTAKGEVHALDLEHDGSFRITATHRVGEGVVKTPVFAPDGLSMVVGDGAESCAVQVVVLGHDGSLRQVSERALDGYMGGLPVVCEDGTIVVSSSYHDIYALRGDG